MRRDKRPFVVEVRRGGAKKAAVSETSAKQKPKPKAQREIVEPLAASVFAPQTMIESSPESQKPSGRILPSLVEPPPVELMAEPDLPRRRGRPPGSKNKSKLGSPRPVAPVSGKRRGRPPKLRTDAPSLYEWANSPAEVVEIDSPVVESSTNVLAAPRSVKRTRRVSRILARYVFGTMPKRSERWKRRRRAD